MTTQLRLRMTDTTKCTCGHEEQEHAHGEIPSARRRCLHIITTTDMQRVCNCLCFQPQKERTP